MKHEELQKRVERLRLRSLFMRLATKTINSFDKDQSEQHEMNTRIQSHAEYHVQQLKELETLLSDGDQELLKKIKYARLYYHRVLLLTESINYLDNNPVENSELNQTLQSHAKKIVHYMKEADRLLSDESVN